MSGDCTASAGETRLRFSHPLALTLYLTLSFRPHKQARWSCVKCANSGLSCSVACLLLRQQGVWVSRTNRTHRKNTLSTGGPSQARDSIWIVQHRNPSGTVTHTHTHTDHPTVVPTSAPMSCRYLTGIKKDRKRKHTLNKHTDRKQQTINFSRAFAYKKGH